VAATHDYEDMHHLVDRLSPAQLRRLRVLVESNPEFSGIVEPAPASEPDSPPRLRLLSFIGIMESGRGDLSERHEEIIRDGLSRPA
jgi:hypothetical protein